MPPPSTRVSRLRRLVPRAALAGLSLALTLGALELYFRAAFYPETGFVVAEEPGLIYRNAPQEGLINERGFRGPFHDGPVPDGTCRIVVIGDSVAFGVGIRDEGDTFVRRFEAALNASPATEIGVRHYEVINAAVGGYNMEQLAANWRWRLADTPHQVVLYAHFFNDLWIPDGLLRWEGERHVCYAMMPHRGQVWTMPLPGPLDGWLSRHSRLYLYLRTRLYMATIDRVMERQDPDEVRERILATTTALLGDWIDEVRRSDRRFVMAVVPTHAVSMGIEECDTWRPGFCSDRRVRERRAAAVAAERGVPVLDLTPALEGTGVDYRIPGPEGAGDYDHPNEAGHEALARELIRQWREQGLDRLCLPGA